MVFLCGKSNAENPLPEGAQFALVSVVSLGHHTEIMTTLEYVHRNVEYFLVLAQLLHPVTLAEDRKDLQGSYQRVGYFPESDRLWPWREYQ